MGLRTGHRGPLCDTLPAQPPPAAPSWRLRAPREAAHARSAATPSRGHARAVHLVAGVARGAGLAAPHRRAHHRLIAEDGQGPAAAVLARMDKGAGFPSPPCGIWGALLGAPRADCRGARRAGKRWLADCPERPRPGGAPSLLLHAGGRFWGSPVVGRPPTAGEHLVTAAGAGAGGGGPGAEHACRVAVWRVRSHAPLLGAPQQRREQRRRPT